MERRRSRGCHTEVVIAGKQLKTQEALAEHFGASLTTVRKWIAKPDFPGGRKGPWSIKAVGAYLSSIGSPLAPRDRAAGGTAAAARLRDEESLRLSRMFADAKQEKLNQDIRRARILNDEREGQLIRRDDVEQWVSAALVELRDLLLAWPAQLGGSVDPKVRKFVVSESERHVRDLLTMMRRRLERVTGGAKA